MTASRSAPATSEKRSTLRQGGSMGKVPSSVYTEDMRRAASSNSGWPGASSGSGSAMCMATVTAPGSASRIEKPSSKSRVPSLSMV